MRTARPGAPDVAEPKLTDGELQIRRSNEHDRSATERLSRRAFSAADVDESDVDEEADSHLTGDPLPGPEPPLEFIAEYGGRIVASASARLHGQWFGGRRVVCAAVGGVAVGIEARGLGVGGALMSALLSAAHDAGAATSALIPSTHRFYAGLGYGIGGRRPVYALATADLRRLAVARPAGLLLRPAVRADAPAVAALVRDRAARASGLLDHGGVDERATTDPTGRDSYVVEVDGAVRGWCLLRRRPPSTRYASYDLAVEDLAGDEPQIEVLLWRLLVGDHPAALRAEAVMPPGSVLEHHLERQREIAEGASWMQRLLDVDAALSGRAYPPSLTTELVLDVTDHVCPWNHGPRLLSVTGGTARVRPAPGLRPNAAVSVADLASLYTAHLDPFDARHQGRLRLADDATAASLRALFAGPPARLARTF